MKIWNDTVALGDTVCTFPVMLRLQPSSIFWTNAAVGDLFPHEKYGITRAESSDGFEKRVSLHDYVRTTWGKPYDRHPTQMALEMCGLWSDVPVAPELSFSDYDLKPFDLIIAPYVMADLKRMWDLSGWDAVVTALGMRTACLAGSPPPMSEMAKIEGRAELYAENCLYQDGRPIRSASMLRDKPLTEIVWYMSKAKLVITADSGPSRMMHGIGTSHLILADSNVAPLSWAAYPGAQVLFCDLKTLTSETVFDRARKILCEST